jgi:hypothetical protein
VTPVPVPHKAPAPHAAAAEKVPTESHDSQPATVAGLRPSPKAGRRLRPNRATR